MSRWTEVPIVGGSYADDTRDWSFQDTVNWLPMRAEREGGRSHAMLRDVPGLRLKSIVGTGPYRGMRDVEGKLFVVSGSTLYRIRTDMTAVEIGTVPGAGPVTMTHNQIAGGNQLVIGIGSSGYVYNTSSGVYSQITDPGFPGLQSADFIGQYIIGIEPQRRYWFHSELVDALNYNTTDTYEAEAQPDKLTRVIVANNEVVAVGERTTEFFTNSPIGNAAFQRSTGVSNDKGSISPHSVVKLDNTVFMLGADGIVYRLDGYRWVRISTHAMEQEIANCRLENAFAFTYEDRGHAIYYLTFPDGKTWGYDVSQGEWARRESYGFDRWRVNGLVRWNGDWFAGDFASGKLYEVDWDYPGLEDQEQIVRRRTFGVMHDQFNRFAVNAVRFRASTGQPEDTADEGDDPVPVFPNLAIEGDLGDGYQGEPVNHSYTVSGGVSPINVTSPSGAVPAGTTRDQKDITGIRTLPGVYSWLMRATDVDGRVADLNDTSETFPARMVGASATTAGLYIITVDGVTRVTDSTTVTGDKFGISFSHDYSVLWVNDRDNGIMYKLNPETFEVLGTATLSGLTYGACVDPVSGDVFAIGLVTGPSHIVHRINANDMTVTTGTTSGYANNAYSLAISPDGFKLYIGLGSTTNGVAVFDTLSMTTDTVLSTGNVVSVAMRPGGGKVVAVGASANHRVIDTATLAVSGNLGNYRNGPPCYHPDGSKYYLERSVGGISVMSDATDTAIGNISGTGTDVHGLAISGDGAVLVATKQFNTDIHFINTATNAIYNTLAINARNNCMRALP